MSPSLSPAAGQTEKKGCVKHGKPVGNKDIQCVLRYGISNSKHILRLSQF